MRHLQDRPRLLESFYGATLKALLPFKRLLKSGGLVEWVFIRVEKLGKGTIFDCRMCGQCVLLSTGMTCPMTCPKQLRNGPCGGVRPNGHCEVLPETPCVWVQAWQRSRRMPVYGGGILRAQPPVDHRLSGASAWINDLTGESRWTPAEWVP